MLIDQISTVYNQIVSLICKYYSNSDANLDIEYLSYLSNRSPLRLHRTAVREDQGHIRAASRRYAADFQ
ncbi:MULTISPECIES: hypothetical protein [unclassified Paenibacillus]|uniref:hypothetical protein n=1 Tax=unclassified Paenibacillus TaxID=185978 RepID=UPI0027808207|nr:MULTISPECIES: hypothetical protein [unclassified Paenibacillus]MDQ0899234.1 hypothetical protein [Paenibacillus sp. V4I7]MDQ0914776.1 hypothetical protein [Paenibacillus sp. V4I5]